MKSLKDFHIHTTYCDGSNSPEEMVEAAIDKGLKTMGFSGHSYTFFDEAYCMMPEDEIAYEKEIRSLAKKYAGRIEILCGVEQDYWAISNTKSWDYIIGSVHYVRVKEDRRSTEEIPQGCCEKEGYIYIPVDESPEILMDGVKAYFGGDFYAFAEEYFSTIADVVSKTGADIIGHFDLVCKFNRDGDGVRKGTFFDESDPRFVKAWKGAVDILVKNKVPFEINTSGLRKGYRAEPYPSKPIRDYIIQCGGRLILSSDSHDTSTLCYEFEKFQEEVL